MSLILLYAGLVLTPFYDILLKVLPYSLPTATDTRMAKIYIGLVLALAIGIFHIFEKGFRPCKNIWVFLFILYIPINISMAPQFPININGIDATNMWVWKPFSIFLCYFLMFMGVQSMDISHKVIKNIFTVCSFCAATMSAYIVIQSFGADQFFDPINGKYFDQIPQKSIVGTLGQPTIVSPFIAMIIPMALYLKRYLIACLMCVAVVLTLSEVAIFAMLVSLMVYSVFIFRRKGVIVILLSLIIAGSLFAGMCQVYPGTFQATKERVLIDNGRFGLWKSIVKKVSFEKIGNESPTARPITGIGIGTYQVIGKPMLQTRFDKAHNEFIEVFCWGGIVGLWFFIMFLWRQARYCFQWGENKPEKYALISSAVCILICSLGTFVFQLGPHCFYSVLIVGLLSNKNLIEEDLNGTNLENFKW